MRQAAKCKWLLGCLAWLCAAAALAQSWPARTIRIVVPYAAGTGLDVIVRLVNEPLSKNLRQPVITENRPGAGGTIGTAVVASAPADGYTVVAVPSSHTMVSLLIRNVPFDPAADFAGVTTMAENPLVLVASSARGWQTVRDVIAAGKAKPGALTFASAGTGTSTHISAEKFRLAGGFEALHIPFKSTTDGLTEVLAGRVDFVYTSLIAAMPAIKDGKLVALAMSSKRSSLLPNVPTIEETGMANSAYSSWLGLLLPAKTPRDIVNRLNAETVKVLQSDDIRERFARIGTEPFTMSPADFDRLIRTELASNERVIRTVGIKPE